MEFSQNDNNNLPLSKFESMLKTNNVLFFDSEEFENIIHYYLNQGKVALAKKAIKLGLEQHPTSVNLKLFKVEVYIFENELPKADKLLNELHNLEPQNEEIYIQKANIFSKQDNHAKAVDVLKSALKFANDTTDLYSLIGMEYLFLDKFEEAKQNFMKCLEQDLEDYSALYNMIYCFDFLDQNEEAIEYLNNYLNSNPYCEVAWHQLGKQYYTIKDYKKALAAYDYAIISDDTFVGAYLEKGKVLEKFKKYEEAIESYTLTLQLEDPTSFALLRIAQCYEKLGKDDLAVQYFYQTVHEDPLLDKGWIAITKFYNKKKNYQKALYYINKAINIDTENVIYWKLYAQINHRLNFLEEAERGYKKTLELGNYEIDTWIARGDILLKIGELEAAIYNFLQAAEFHPENAELEYRLGGLYFLQHETEKGTFHLKNAVRSNKEYVFIIEELFPNVFNKPQVKKLLNVK
ncbi:tetratricopeptide repeat protein [Lacinutrix sp. C3R15]|uniref:tetratricopeptide repeat protein n=1 Tax=Flavobacteriaceae TaxID=49546 RepID=UPI001C085A6C|nr:MULTISPECIES: tetratricopeptide repeat protein [Flavobacteriaceae]MBU2940693.1 tetratricopeptide repeat protein [Lacinutrix sp. C3R15]MDO6624011.1 tetratricopeptide repeat protein [Oceanihabitans sp. 1_MG-2023]